MSEVTYTWEQVYNAYFKGIERGKQFEREENKESAPSASANTGSPKPGTVILEYLLSLSRKWDCHPEGWDLPCECSTCMENADISDK